MVSATQERCDTCGGKMLWNGAAAKLRCDSCGTLREPAANDAIVGEHDLLATLAKQKPRGATVAGTHTVKCQECGAEVEFADGVTATHCSFCNSPSVLAQDSRDDRIKPEGVVPFAIEREQAVAAFKKWIGGRWFRPGDLAAQASVSELRGMYVPFWTFNTHVASSWTADAGYSYDVAEEYTDPQGQLKVRTVRKVRWEPAYGTRDDDYVDHLVCASLGLPGKLLRRGGFKTSGLRAWSPEFLTGFQAESYAVELRDGWITARGEIAGEQEQRCRRDVPGDTQRNLRANHRFDDQTFKHVLLPIWIAAFRYHDKVFRFLVNGQSGAVSGEAPRSWTKIIIFVAVLAALIAGLVILLHKR